MSQYAYYFAKWSTAEEIIVELEEKNKDLEANLEKAWIVINAAGYEDSDIQLREFMEQTND